MEVFIAQGYNGDVFVTDDRDSLPPDITDFNAIHLSEKTTFDEKFNYAYVDLGSDSHAFTIRRNPGANRPDDSGAI